MKKDKLQKLCDGVRALLPAKRAPEPGTSATRDDEAGVEAGVDIRLVPSALAPGHWSVMVWAGDLILLNTDFDTLDRSLDQALTNLAKISQRMMAAVRPTDSTPPPPPSPKPEPEK